MAVLVTSNFGTAFSQNNSDEALNLNLTGGDILSTSNSFEIDSGPEGTDFSSAYTH